MQTVVGNVITGGAVVDEVATGGPFDVIYSFGLFDYLDDAQMLTTAFVSPAKWDCGWPRHGWSATAV